MKLGVIGEPCIDYIHREGHDTTKHLGGILYSVVSLAVIAGKRSEIYPIMNLGDDEFNNIAAFLSTFRNIKLDYVYRSAHSTRIVKLYYKTGSGDAICHGSTYDREESSTEPALPLGISQINAAAGEMDGLLVNMVSGKDIELDTLLSLRKEYGNYIHMDIHNIVMRTGKDGSRFRGSVKEWFKWCTCCDTLQMNEEEMSFISGGRADEYETAKKILNGSKVKIIVITRGSLGVTLFQKKKEPEASKIIKLDRIDIPPIKTDKFLDSTGCGDVFASAFFYKNLENGLSEVLTSVKYANELASKNSELRGVEELNRLL